VQAIASRRDLAAAGVGGRAEFPAATISRSV